MPQSHTTRTVQIRVDAESTVSAVEIRLSGTRTEMQTARTTFGGISRIDRSDFNACGSRLVFDKAAELGERPAMQMPGHKSLGASANTCQIFQNDALPALFGVCDDALADAMVRVRDKSILTPRDTPEHALGGAAAVGLETRPYLLKRSLLVANLLRRVESIVRRDRNTLHAQVNTQAAGWLRDFRRVRVDRNMQIALAISEYQVCAADFPGPQLLTHRGGHLQLTGDFSFGAGGQSGFAEVSREGERARIVSHGRKLFELVLFVALAGEGFGDFRNRVDDVLRWQVGLLTYLIVRRVVQIVPAVQFLFARHFSDQVTGFRELAHRRFQFLRDLGRDDKLCFHRLLKLFHALIVAQLGACLTLNPEDGGRFLPAINGRVSAPLPEAVG
jgi:hypothetical protein